MPRPGPRRPNTAVRLDEQITEFLDNIAAWRGVTRSDVIRDAIAYYLEAEPGDWPGSSARDRGDRLTSPDGGCQHCDGTGCEACDARHLPAEDKP